jgi:hypothetical protein
VWKRFIFIFFLLRLVAAINDFDIMPRGTHCQELFHYFICLGVSTVIMCKSMLSERERELFRKVGASGGRARAKKMTKEERAASARRAAQARWAKKKKPHSA